MLNISKLNLCKLDVCKLGMMILVSATSACMYSPSKTSNDLSDSSSCEMFFPEWELSAEKLVSAPVCASAEARLCLIAMGVVPVGSFVVSGSIVLTGNTLRWLEYQGRCDESHVNQGLSYLKALANGDDLTANQY